MHRVRGETKIVIEYLLICITRDWIEQCFWCYPWHQVCLIESPVISSRGTKKSQFRSYRRREAKNAPKTKKSQQTALSRKKSVCSLPDKEKPVSLVSDEKKPICAVPGRKITTNGILRVKTLIKNIFEITRGTNYIWICAGGYCGMTLH